MASTLEHCAMQCVVLATKFLIGHTADGWAIQDKLRKNLRYFQKLVIATLLCAGTANAIGAPITESVPSCVWYADNGTLHQIEARSNQVTRSSMLDQVTSISMSGSDCGVWALADKHLYKYDQNAVQTLKLALQSLTNIKANFKQVVTDPADRSVWLAGGKNLSHVSDDGRLINTWDTPGTIRTIVLALDRSIWVLGNKQLWHYNRQGVLLYEQQLQKIVHAEPKHLLFDNFGQILWLGGEKQLTRIDVRQADAPAIRVDLPNQIRAMATNPLTGEVWIASADTLFVYDRDGSRTRTIDLLAQNLGQAEDLAFDPVTQSLWVVTRDALGRFSATGDFISRLLVKENPIALAAPAFTLAPTLTLVRPPQSALTNNAQPTITYRYGALCNGASCMPGQDYFNGLAINVTLNGNLIGPFNLNAETREATFTPAVRLPEGLNSLHARATDRFGYVTDAATAQFTIDTIPPEFISISPLSGTVFSVPNVTIQGTVNDVDAVVVLNGVGAAANHTTAGPVLNFNFPVTLAPNQNSFTLSAIDKAGNIATHDFVLTFNPPPPLAPIAASITVGKVVNGFVTLTGSAGAVGAGMQVIATNTRTQQVVFTHADTGGSFTVSVPAKEGDVLSIAAVNQWGGASPSIQVNVAGNKPIPVDPDSEPGIVPPDPVSIAPHSRAAPISIANGTAFLYSGTNPIQTGVVAGAIETRRIAVIRGVVTDRDGRSLPGVRIRILDRPEFGQTYSRADGRFDIAVNGGGHLTLDYTKAGYLPIQRTVKTPWQDYVDAPDVVMLTLDPQVTTIDLAAPSLQVARGSVVRDQNGTRQATLLFPQGTTASIVLPDGTTQALGTLSVRATEYTVGPNGPKAMPGELPPTSGYTYAVELSVDEAITAGARTVQFNQPVYQYVENFLNFPVGGIVPAGYYDRQKATWIPSDNGVIIKVLGIEDGNAVLDTDGDGQADDNDRLAMLNIADGERTQLAALYTPGTSLWRVPIRHFTPWDYNWPIGPPDDAVPPEVPDLQNHLMDITDVECGSIIECQSQSLGESVGVTGTGLSLNYKSSRTAGYDTYSIQIPLSGPTAAPGLKRIDLDVSVAGQRFTQSFSGAPDQNFTFRWDGKDAYGRILQGPQRAIIRVGYVYSGVYRTPSAGQRSFASFGEQQISGDLSRAEITIAKEQQVTLGNWHASSVNLGGWTLSSHHTYDPVGQVLYLGDGSKRSAQNQSRVISTLAGNGSHNFSGDGGPAALATVRLPRGIAVDAAGNIYFITFASASGASNVVRKIGTDGTITTVAGGGTLGISPAGTLATSVALSGLNGIAIDTRGNLYLTDGNFKRVLKVTPDGIIKWFAGRFGQGSSLIDGVPALETEFRYPTGVAADAQGNVYVADSDGKVVRKIAPDGIITTVAGQWRAPGYSNDGGLATASRLVSPAELAVDRDSNLYIVDSQRIRKITSDGIISTVAGNASSAYPMPPDGGLATETPLSSPYGLTADAAGNIYVSENGWNRIRKIDRNGIISTVAGTGRSGFEGDGGPANAAQMNGVHGIAADPAGNLYITDVDNARVRKVSSFFPRLPEQDVIIASEDGNQLYHFNMNGRHLRTLSGTTGAELFHFTYDGQGALVEIKDGDGNVTRIERDSDGKPIAIVAPDNQRTALALDSAGNLSSIANPASEAVQLEYGHGGLLTRFINARGHATTISYNAAGRLIKDQNAMGGYWSLSRTGTNANYEVRKASALDRVTRYQVKNLATGETRRTNTLPDGSIDMTVEKTNGTTENVAADGTITTTQQGGDPRFGMAAPFVKIANVKTPSGLMSTATTTREVTLQNPLDLMSLVKQTDTMTVNGNIFKTVYDAVQRQTTAVSPLNRQIIVKADTQGRPISEKVAGVEPLNYAYDTRGRLASISQGTGTALRMTRYAYNADGYVESVTDAINRVTRYEYDAAGRAKTVTLPDGRVIAFSFDANGNVTSVTPPGRPAHGFTYNAVDLATSYTPPALENQPVATSYEYNLDKQPTKAIRPDGKVVEYGYDDGGRLATLTTPDGVVNYGYTANSGQVASISTSDDIGLSFSYDGFLHTGTTFSGPVVGSISAEYDNFFRTSQLGTNGVNVGFSYDEDGLLISAGSMTFTRDTRNGFLTGSKLGQITTSQSYDSFGQLASFTAKHGPTVLYEEQYARDKAGRLTQKTVTITGQMSVYGYSYDAAGRLIDVTKDGAPAGHFEYDANGNRTLAYGISAAYDAQDRLIESGGAQYSYTANGELKQTVVGNSTTTYDYDVFGNLKRVTLAGGTQLDYLVDGKHRRIGKKIDGQLTQAFLYQDQLKPAAELDGHGNVVARFVYAGKANVPEYLVKGDATYRIVTDQLGSVRLVVDSVTGEVVQRIDYDDWGNVQSDSNPGFQPFGFAGGLYDRDTGLVRFGARDYDPKTARWTAKDPIGFEGSDSNLYSYVDADPINYFDPEGLSSLSCASKLDKLKAIGRIILELSRDPTTDPQQQSERAHQQQQEQRKQDDSRQGDKKDKNSGDGNGRPNPQPPIPRRK